MSTHLPASPIADISSALPSANIWTDPNQPVSREINAGHGPWHSILAGMVVLLVAFMWLAAVVASGFNSAILGVGVLVALSISGGMRS